MSASSTILPDQALDTLFRTARTYKAWQDKPVTDVLVQAVYDLMKWGPTSANSCPARFIFVKSQEAKEKLKPCLDAGNVDAVMSAPITALIINDKEFYENFPTLFPHAPKIKDSFIGNEAKIQDAVMRNASLQGAYFILAARALGLDCGPMSGFNKDALKQAFFPDKPAWEANFICNLGYGDPSSLYPRGPRLEFSEVCQIL